MNKRAPLVGINVYLSGSVPDNASREETEAIESFVRSLCQAIFREGGTVVHGSHPSFLEHLEKAARPVFAATGIKVLTLVRAQKYASSSDDLAGIELQREFASVEIVPGIDAKPDETLVPMREWMAERCDVIVAIGGRWYDLKKELAGVPQELEEFLSRGKPGFTVSRFGGAIAGYVNDDPTVLGRLRNGLTADQNRVLAEGKAVEETVNAIVAQIKLLPLGRPSVRHTRHFRILALDGGGIRGAFTASVLAKWDDMLKSGGNNRLVDHFDLVAGTSTGAILAIGLGMGLTPAELLAFYREKGPAIFPKNRTLRHWLKSKHESKTLRELLDEVLGNRKLSADSRCRLVIPTVRAVQGEAEAIVTAHSPDRTAYRDISAVDAAIASSAAPTYFDEATWDNPIAAESFLDGGIWANNPILPAIAEAVRYLGVPLDRIDVLSVGTVGHESDFTKSFGKGKAGWGLDSVDLFFAAQEHAAVSIADSLLSPARHLRVNQRSPCKIALDDVEAIEDLARRGSDVAKDSFVAVRSRFLNGVYAPDWRQ